MSSVKFIEVDVENRTATFDVDGVEVTRNIPKKFDGTIDDYLQALARGLMQEAIDSLAKPIGETSFVADEVLAGE